MRHARAVVVVLALATSLAGGWPSPFLAHAAAGQEAGPEATRPAGPEATPSASQVATVPAIRLLIALPGTSAAPDDPGLAGLTARLRLADPVATITVLPPGATGRTAGPFHIVAESQTQGAATSTTLRVDTAEGLPFSVEVAALPDPGRDAVGHVTIVEILGGPEGVTAWRVGDLTPSPDELRLPAWRLPDRGVDAVMLEGAWWSLALDTLSTVPTAAAAPVTVPDPRPRPDLAGLRARVTGSPVSRLKRLVDLSLGDVTGDGRPDLALSFRRPFQRTLLNASRPRRAWVDARGMSAHVGLFRPDDLSSIWVAGTLVRPVHRLAACTGALAVTYSTLRRSAVVAATAWAWQGFGFLPLPELPGAGRPTCIDIDRDGRPDAAIIERG